MAAQISEGDRYLGRAVDVIYLDFWRAFDTVYHNLLIGKVKKQELDEWTVRWIEDCSRWTCLSKGVGLDDLQRYLCILTILWFCGEKGNFFSKSFLVFTNNIPLKYCDFFNITFISLVFFCHENLFEVVVSQKVKFTKCSPESNLVSIYNICSVLKFLSGTFVHAF